MRQPPSRRKRHPSNPPDFNFHLLEKPSEGANASVLVGTIIAGPIGTLFGSVLGAALLAHDAPASPPSLPATKTRHRRKSQRGTP
jgi:hypothetical protein